MQPFKKITAKTAAILLRRLLEETPFYICMPVFENEDEITVREQFFSLHKLLILVERHVQGDGEASPLENL